MQLFLARVVWPGAVMMLLAASLPRVQSMGGTVYLIVVSALGIAAAQLGAGWISESGKEDSTDPAVDGENTPPAST